MDFSTQIKKDLTNGIYTYQTILDDINDSLIKEQKENVSVIDLPLYYFKKGIAESYALTTAKDYDKAIESFNHVLNICDKQNNKLSNINSESTSQIITRNEILITISHREVGIIHFNNDNYKNAYKEFNYTNSDPYSNSYSLMIIAYELIYHITPPDIYNMINEAINILEEMSHNNIEIATYFLGILYSDDSLKRKDLNKASAYLKKAQSQGFPITDNEVSDMIKKAENNEYKNQFSIAKDKWILIRTENNSQKNNSSKECYVATCVYGSYNCPPVWTLRRYRDYTLAQNPFGRLFIRIYYATSPTIVELFGNQLWFHKLFKKPLDSLVNKLQNNGVESTPYNDK